MAQSDSLANQAEVGFLITFEKNASYTKRKTTGSISIWGREQHKITGLAVICTSTGTCLHKRQKMYLGTLRCKSQYKTC